MSNADRYAEQVALAEDLARQKAARDVELAALAQHNYDRLPAKTIGDLPVSVADMTNALIVKDVVRADLESGRAKAVALAAMYGAGAILDALTGRPPT